MLHQEWYRSTGRNSYMQGARAFLLLTKDSVADIANYYMPSVVRCINATCVCAVTIFLSAKKKKNLLPSSAGKKSSNMRRRTFTMINRGRLELATLLLVGCMQMLLSLYVESELKRCSSLLTCSVEKTLGIGVWIQLKNGLTHHQGRHSCASVCHRPFIFCWMHKFQLNLTITRPLGDTCIHNGVKISHGKSLTVPFLSTKYQNIELHVLN